MSDATPEFDLLEKYCLHGQGKVETRNGSTRYVCSEGYTVAYYDETWKKSGKTFSSLKPEEFASYCESKFIQFTETKINPGDICSIVRNADKIHVKCENNGSTEITDLYNNFCADLLQRKIKEEAGSCSINQTLNPDIRNSAEETLKSLSSSVKPANSPGNKAPVR